MQDMSRNTSITANLMSKQQAMLAGSMRNTMGTNTGSEYSAEAMAANLNKNFDEMRQYIQSADQHPGGVLGTRVKTFQGRPCDRN